jgi:PAS domain S-box-containing protein
MPRVLIVDDNADNRYMLRALLQGHGHVVDEACHGAEALSRAREQLPDLVISDLLMPVLDGYTLLRKWKAEEPLRSVPFLVYTATYTDPRDERLALDLGADAFLIKPAEPEPLLACINEVLARKDRADSAVRAPQIEEGVLQQYSEALVRKLEKKTLQLEQTNRELLAEIAERKRTEEALRLRDRAIQAVNQGILISDASLPDIPIVFASAGFERMTGYRAEEVLGKNALFLRGRSTDVDTVAEVAAALAAGVGCSVEILNYRKDGSAFWNQLTIAPVLGPADELTHFVAVFNDVTQRRKLEEQYRQAQKMEAVGQLAGGVAHDFNNLLTVINGYSELVRRGLPAGDPLRDLLTEIHRAGERAGMLTRHLLAFSRRQVLELRVLNLNAVVSDIEKMLRRLIGEDIVFVTQLDPDLAQVKVDPGQMEQVLLNLAVNARDAMPTGGSLTIETQMVSLDESYCQGVADLTPGDYVLLAVSDTGCGMSPAIQARIFEPFFTTKEMGKGTGLGLATVHGIIKQSRGHVAVYSEVGHGTTFKVYLPAVSAPATRLRTEAWAALASGTETLLIVEDEAAVRALAIHILRGCGYRVLAAANGKEALRLAEQEPGPIHLLISDVVMPHLGGRELAQQFTALRPGTRVLFLSGYTDDAVIRHGVLEAECAFLQKPFTPSSLAQKVRSVLDNTRS